MAYRVSKLNDLYPHDCETLHQVRTQYADWRAILDKKLGYLRYYAWLNGGQVMLYEHHLVAQAAYGDIPAGHHVHHVNQVRTDNRAENLQVLSAREHRLLHIDFLVFSQHGRERPRTYTTITCDQCGKPFRRQMSHLRRTHNYCSPACAQHAARTVARPRPEELVAMLRNSSYEAVGRHFGVTGKAVKKWAVQYGLA